ncbi:MAG: TMEM165/GDT1 family protein, partial [Jatrophihabitantaceae bacterium]
AKYHDPIAVGLGATLGLWTAALLAITAGRTLLRYISLNLLHRVGAVIFVGFAIVSIVSAARG